MTAPTPIAGLTTLPDIRKIPLAQIHESPLNTRTHFDPAKLAELATSMKMSEQLTPVLVRPSKLKGKPGFELAAGHRRRRAAPMAGLDTLLAIVRDLDDRTFLEILTIDNLQREDVHPLEEAQGYRNLLTIDGYDVKQIAERVSKDKSYVYDRLTLLKLIPAAQELFFANRFSLGHAILLARVAASVQKDLLDDRQGVGGLWRSDHGHATLGLLSPDAEEGPYGRLVPVSVRQLQEWIDTHVRFDAGDETVPELFPETTATLVAADEAQEKVIPITYDYHVRPEAKDEDGARTYGPTSWKRADGQPFTDNGSTSEKPSKTCDHSVIGLIAVGEGRGESFRVCVDKKRCTVHWGAEIRERNKRERERGASASKSADGKDNGAKANANAERQREAQLAKQAEREAEEKRYEKALPAVLTAIGNAIKKAPTNSASPIAKFVWEMLRDGLWGLEGFAKTAAKYVSRGVSSSDFLCHVAMCAIVQSAEDGACWDELEDDVKMLKLGINIGKIVDAVAPKAPPKVTTKPEPKKAAVKKAAPPKKTPKPAKGTPAKGTPAKKSPVVDFMKPKQPDAILGAVVGHEAMPRTDITKKLWQYIKKNGLQDANERRIINADEKLRAVFGGKSKVSMFEMTKLINKHLAD